MNGSPRRLIRSFIKMRPFGLGACPNSRRGAVPHICRFPRQDSPSFFPRSPERGGENSRGQRPWNVRPSSDKLCRSERNQPAQPAVRAPRQGLTTAGPSFSRGVAPGYFRSSLQDAQERLFPQSLAPWRLWVGAQGAKDLSPRTRATTDAIRPSCRTTILYARYRRPQRPRCGSPRRLL